MMTIIEVQCAFPDEQIANHLCSLLITSKLIACANIVSAKSIYTWSEVLQNEPECLAFMKTTPMRLEGLLQKLKSSHPYQLPAILYWECKTTDEYGLWVDAQTQLIS